MTGPQLKKLPGEIGEQYFKELYAHYKQSNYYSGSTTLEYLGKNPLNGFSKEHYEGDPQTIWSKDYGEITFFREKEKLSTAKNGIYLLDILNEIGATGIEPSHFVVTVDREYLEYMNTTTAYISADVYELDRSKLKENTEHHGN
jgi:hypothetical protein